MATTVTEPKTDPAVIVRRAYDGLEAGKYEVVAAEISSNGKAGLSGKIEDLYRGLPRP